MTFSILVKRGVDLEMSQAEQFDPLSDLFIAQFARPTNLEPVNLRTLTPFQRALLVIDGTVTKFIEAYTMEPIEVVRLSQETRRLPVEQSWLEASEDTTVLVREVLLQAKYSHALYAYALSFVVPDRLPEQVRERLNDEDEGLGRILNDYDLETRREVLWYGRERTGELPPEVQRRIEGEFLSRTYRVIWNGHPVMLINEKFPIHTDRLPSHH
jgi:chorismate-pyruvate lyase